jgi:putative restriction endonuclease
MQAVFPIRPLSPRDDLPEEQYSFPRQFLPVVRHAQGDWILYSEPLRAAGQPAYCAAARVGAITEETGRPGICRAAMADYLDFTTPVPLRIGRFCPESAIRHACFAALEEEETMHTIRLLPKDEFDLIFQLGFQNREMPSPALGLAVAEEEAAYGYSGILSLRERKFRDPKFAKLIQQSYQATCALTGLKIVNNGRCEIEAAHIVPVEHSGPDSVRNGIALSRTVHWLFDRGMLSLTDEGEILYARGNIPPQLLRILNADRRARFPKDPVLRPHPKFLQYHRENIFKGN